MYVIRSSEYARHMYLRYAHIQFEREQQNGTKEYRKEEE